LNPQTSTNSKGLAEIIAGQIESALGPMGFKRQKTTLVSEREEALLVVALRKNSSTRQHKLVVTLEVCIYCKELARHFKVAKILNQPLECRWWECHWSKNIGCALGDERRPKFWTVHTKEESVDVSLEMIRLLKSWGLPLLEALSTTESLAAYWRDGGSATTKWARANYTKILDTFLLERLFADRRNEA
jgi:hypothetical protein